MAKYSDIKGFTVQTVSSDPVASGLAGASWSSTPSLNTARIDMSSGGTTTAGIVAGGYDGEGYPSGYTGLTETWNGSAWTETGDMNSGRTTHGFGTSTALIAGAGNRGVSSPPTAPGYQNLVESWNGSAWTEVAEYNSNLSARGTAGQSGTAGIVFGGITPSSGGSPNSIVTENWNGSSWTEVNDLNTARYNLATNAGTYTSAVGVGGQFPSPPTDGTAVESWDGTNWTEVSELNTARNQMGGSGTGNTSLLVFGGNPGVKANTESWDGSSWTERNDLATARKNNGGLGTSATNAIYAGGQDATTYTAVSEEFSPAGATESLQVEGQLYFNSTTNTFKETLKDAGAGAWASIASGNTARRVASGVGTSVSDGMVIAGYPEENEVETWNGSSWTEVAEVNTGRGSAGASSNSPSSSALFFGGDVRPGSPAFSALNESWNGSAWTEVGDLPAAINGNAGAGVSNTSALSFGGSLPSKTGATKHWDGSSWTEGGTIATARYYLSGVGTTTAALAINGFRTSPSSAILKFVEEYDGSSWSAISDTNSGHTFAGASGTTTSAMVFGGEGPSYPGGAMAQSENWNGTAWTEVADLSAANLSPAGFGGSGISCISSFGNTPGGLLATAEEFSAGLSNKTITAS